MENAKIIPISLNKSTRKIKATVICVSINSVYNYQITNASHYPKRQWLLLTLVTPIRKNAGAADFLDIYICSQ